MDQNHTAQFNFNDKIFSTFRLITTRCDHHLGTHSITRRRNCQNKDSSRLTLSPFCWFEERTESQSKTAVPLIMKNQEKVKNLPTTWLGSNCCTESRSESTLLLRLQVRSNMVVASTNNSLNMSSACWLRLLNCLQNNINISSQQGVRF